VTVRAAAPAKINLALVVGPLRPDGKHDVTTVLQRVDLADTIAVKRAETLTVDGFEGDTLVTRALERLAREVGVEPAWSVRIEKRIPVAAGLGGGSSDAATALRLVNELLASPLRLDELQRLAGTIGADVPFFLTEGPQIGEGDGTQLSAVELPLDYAILLVLREGATKDSTAAVYAAFDVRGGQAGYTSRRADVLRVVREVEVASDLAALPPNDLADADLSGRLLELGAFRADVSGAGPVVYGLFEDERSARAAEASLEGVGDTWIVCPAW
jgi:4-diphosphocytidyl-2-C-methyl-D-erythritol kinase